MESYRAGVRSDPKNVHAHTRLGDLFFQQKQFREAQAEYQAATRLDPGRAAAHLGLGWVHQEAGEPAKALAAFQAALALDPSLVGARKAVERIEKGLTPPR
jgi:tetratricopeptide (TPR) repeat protein